MKEKELLCEVARLYYEQGLTQQDISNRLFISRSSVSRLIKEARETGVVEITIHYPYDRMRILEYEFQNRFHLDDIRISDSENMDEDEDFSAVTKMGASYVNSLLRDDMVLGVTWGKSVSATLKELKPVNYLPRLNVVQMAGSVDASNPSIDGPDIVHSVANKYGSKYRYIPVPLAVENKLIRDSLLNNVNVKETLQLAENANVMVTGIYGISEWSSFLKKEEVKYLKDHGAVGHICGHYYDADGKLLEMPVLDDRTICAGNKIFSDILFRLGIAANPNKATAVLAALRGGLVNALVTNTSTAYEIIRLDDASKGKKKK
ncbi:MAG: sugar-binding domain-containing protein [Erysipelotrichaceae bacterium]|nr:sugar-binding domain-containing protein [Erysipelotrichaceae bacterium]